MVDCSEKLKALREARGLTQLQVANRIGISKAMISAYETASTAPSIEVLIRLSRLFGVSVDYLDDESVALISALVNKIMSKEND